MENKTIVELRLINPEFWINYDNFKTNVESESFVFMKGNNDIIDNVNNYFRMYLYIIHMSIETFNKNLGSYKDILGVLSLFSSWCSSFDFFLRENMGNVSKDVSKYMVELVELTDMSNILSHSLDDIDSLSRKVGYDLYISIEMKKQIIKKANNIYLKIIEGI